MFSLRNAVISGGQFITANNLHFHSRTGDVQRGLEILREHIVPGAFHDSAERYEPPKCLPRTREAVLKKILDWVKDPRNSKKLFLWLYGPAGVGKSAIAQTIADICEKEGLLAASFFFSRTAAGRSDETRLMATIAYQIALSIPTTRDAICLALERDPSVVSRSLLAQVQTLILDPLNKGRNRRDPRSHAVLIIIDGLDECGDSQAQKHILQALCSLIKLHIPLIFLIASRPEYWIRDSFNVEALNSQTLGVALDDTYRPEDDLKIFFHSRFEEIKINHPLKAHFSSLWPPSHSIERLIKKSSGQFIYASTVMNYVASASHRPEDRLDIVLGVSPFENDAPFAQLDALYEHILKSSSNTENAFDILSLLILDVHVRKYPKFITTIQFIEALFEYRPGELQLRLRDFSAIVHVPIPEGNLNYLDETVHIYHASFVDFLLDRSRAGEFFLDSSIYHARLARFWIRLCSKCSHPASVDVPDTTMQRMIIISHCLRSTPTSDLLADLRKYDPLVDLFPSNASYLDEFGHPAVRFTKWLATYDKSPHRFCLGAPEYHKLNFDNWVQGLIKGYPNPFQSLLPAILSFPQFLVKYHREISSILMPHENAYEMVRTVKVDGNSFRFKRSGPDTFDLDLLEMIRESLSDTKRAGKFLVTPIKLSKLAFAVSQYLFERSNLNDSSDSEGEGDTERYPFRRLPGPESDESDDEIEGSELFVALTFLPIVLGKSSPERKLAILLKDHALQFSSTDSHYTERRALAIASLTYIRKCRIPFVDHNHEIEWIHDVCIICSELRLTLENETNVELAPQDLQTGITGDSSKTFVSLSRLFKKRTLGLP